MEHSDAQRHVFAGDIIGWEYGPWRVVHLDIAHPPESTKTKLISAANMLVCSHKSITDANHVTETLRSIDIMVNKVEDGNKNIAMVLEVTYGEECNRAYIGVRRPLMKMGVFLLYDPVQPRCIDCLRMLSEFYSSPETIDALLVPVVNKTVDVSNRMLEFFCVTYSVKNHVVYKHAVGTSGDERIVDVHDEYTKCLKKWKRECFDFFQRYKRIFVVHPVEGKLLQTTTGQLHGLYWAHMLGVLQYVRANHSAVMREMSSIHGKNRREIKACKFKGIARPRKPLIEHSGVSRSSYKKMQAHRKDVLQTNLHVVFDDDDDE